MGSRRAQHARRLAIKLRSDLAVTDSELHELYPLPLRTMAPAYWTPISVALRASRLLVDKPLARVLDIGAGAGKFCTVGALTTEGTFFGVEQREHLVECAREVSALMGATDASFIHGVFSALDPADYDAFYFFNPFEENLWPKESQFDFTLDTAGERFAEDVRSARCFLRAAKQGTRVVTFNGMGGPLPRCYELVERDHMSCSLELWVKDD